MIRTLIVFILVFAKLTTQAQWLGTSPSIAINPKNTTNVVLGTSSNRTYYTLDNGKIWQESRLTNANLDSHVSIIADSKGYFYALYATSEGQNNSIVVQVSKNGGVSWEEPISVQSSQEHKLVEPSISVDVKGNIFVTWVALKEADDKSEVEILFSKSSGGKKWSLPSSIFKSSEAINTASFNPTSAISADGKMYFVGWQNANSVWLDRSFNAGDIWLRHDISVGSVNASTSSTLPLRVMPMLSIDASKSNRQGMLFFVWAEQRSESSESSGVYYVRSTNLGDHWTTPSKISDESGVQYFVSNCAQDYVTGSFYSAFYGYASEEGLLRFYLATTHDGASSFAVEPVAEYAVSADELKGVGYHVGISAAKGTVALAWCEVKEDGSSVIHTSIKDRSVAKK
jgi:hypothetical protein